MTREGDDRDEQPRILGKLERTIASSAPPVEKLTAAAELHHEFSFDEVGDIDESLDYEPRSSTSCRKCLTMWLGSKAGEVLRLRLGGARPRTDRPRVDGGVRALAHVHRLGQLLVGLDLGYLLVFDEDDTEYGRAGQQCHIARALAQPEAARLPYRLPYRAGFVIEDDATPERFMYGITAIAELPADDADPFVDVAILTRAPELFIARLERDAITIRGRHPLPGWGRSLAITGSRGDEMLVCVTRSGEFREWSCRSLRQTPPETTPLHEDRTNLLPTAVAAPAGPHARDQALLIGASDGLYIRRKRGGRPVHVAVTRSAVLSIATVEVPGHGGADPRHYVALGLEDGRLRVVEEHALFAWIDGQDAPAAHDFRVVLGDAVLTLEILDSREPMSRFVLVGLRNHCLRLFHVRSRESLLHGLRALWRAAIGEPDRATRLQLDAQLATLLDVEARLRKPSGTRRDHALRYLLVDDVLPAWTRTLGGSDARLVAHACEIVSGADDKVLYRLSATMGELAGRDADALIRLSQACLVAMPQRDAQRWRAFVSYHLKQFHACASHRELSADLPRLQHWGRFVRKYLLLGETFAGKRFRLSNLIERNRETHKYLDALIYAAQLEQQRYDLKWSKVARRDQHGRAHEIARVELIENVAIVITTSAEIVFFDILGNALPIIDGDARHNCLTPDRSAHPSGAIRTRVARVTRKQGSWLRIALSWVTTAQAEPPLLTVFDVQFADQRIELRGRHAVNSELRAHPDGTEVEVHGLFGLPGAEAFVVGLDSSDSPLALLQQSTDEPAPRWVLSGLSTGHGSAPPPAVLSTPVRAVAALEIAAPGCYLAAAGAADGSLRFTVFDLGRNVIASDTGPTLLVHPINDLALAVRSKDPEYGYVCYAGTETGESLCLLVRIELDTRTIVTKQLWRDLHHSAVVAVRPTKPLDQPSQPLFGEEVVFIVTQDGHLAIHKASRSNLAGEELSDSQNFLFEGMRFDRINLPPGLSSWASPRSRSGFLAAYPNGVLLYGELCAPRESEAHDHLTTTTDELYAKVMQDKLFYGADTTEPHNPEENKLAICAMVRIGGGALRNYVLRRQLALVHWDALDEAGLHTLLTRQLTGLDVDVDEERARIKLVVKTVSMRVLDLDPKQIFEHCRPGRSYDRITTYPRVRLACRFLADYLVCTTGQSQPGVVRVRMTIMHALFRVNVLWHAALDEQSARHIPLALREVLTVSLRDDDRILCVETLRAVAVVLRNIGVLLRSAEGEHLARLRTSFFPLGLGTLQWLVSTILENFTRYRRHGPPLLLSTPWSYVTVLVMLIRLFPGDALGLCDQISQRGLGDSIEAIIDRLNGRSVRALRSRLRELWTMPFLRERAQSRAVFIELFDECNISQKLIGYEIATGDSDYVRASELLTTYRYLALLWKVNHASDLTEIPSRWTRSGGLPQLTGSLAIMTRILQAFLDIARTRPEDRVAKLRTQIASLLRDSQHPPDAVRLVLDRVVEHWQAILEPKIPTRGEAVLERRVAGMMAERNNSLVYAIEGDDRRVVTALRYPLDSRARLEFNRDARLGRELAERYPDSFVAVHELDPMAGRAIMDRLEPATALLGDLEARDPDVRTAIARRAATQLARALRCLHVEGLHHGDLRAENVFVSGTADPTFRLGDLRATPGDIETSVAALKIPSVLHDAAAAADGVETRLDLVALTLFVLEVLTGETLKPRVDQAALAQLAAGLTARGDDVSQAIARMLGASPYRAAAEFESAMPSELPPFEHKPLAGRVQAEFDVFISYDSDDSAVARMLDEQLTRSGVVPYFDRREALPDRWWNPLQRALNRSRGFAILVGDAYRPHGHQHQEVQVAREAARKDRLPFHVFLIGATEPREFRQEFRHDPVVRLGRDIQAMASHIVRSFQHPIETPRDHGAVRGPVGAVRSAAGSWQPPNTQSSPVIGEPPLPLPRPTETVASPPVIGDTADDAGDGRSPG